MKWLHQFQFAGYYAAIDQGYYEEAGLDVELIEARPGKSPMLSVLDGEAEYGVATSDIVKMRANGEPVVALAVIMQNSPLVLISSRQAGVQSIHDLAGKRVMLQDGSADLLSMLRVAGVSPDSIEFVDHDFSYQSLIDGKASAFSGYLTNEPYSLSKAGIDPVIFYPQAEGVDFYGDALFTTEAHLAEHPQQVKAFRDASLRGWEYALTHTDEIIDLILAKYSTRKSRAELEFEAVETARLIRNDLFALGHMNPYKWKYISQILQGEGMIHGSPDIDGMLYKEEPVFPTLIFAKWALIGLLGLCLMGLILRRQCKANERLIEEIRLREEGEELLRKREQEFRDLFVEAPVAFIIWDTELTIKAWNHAAEALFGWKEEEVIGKNASEFLIPESARKKIESGKAALHKKRTLTQVNENNTKDGRIIWCKWNNMSQKDVNGHVTEFHSMATDVTDEVELQNRLENANEAKDVLLAHTSHEIRNPLSAIMGFSRILLEEATDPENKEMAEIICEGAERMLNILNDLLDSSKIDAGKMKLNLAQVDLGRCIQKNAKLFSQLILNKDLNFRINVPEDPTLVQTDERRIGQILANLISNASKFTEQGEIFIEVQPDGNDHVMISVSDTGIGMSAETIQHIFEPYTQAQELSNATQEGTGLGLSLTQKLVELLKGTITASSEPGKGTHFTVRLPREWD